MEVRSILPHVTSSGDSAGCFIVGLGVEVEQDGGVVDIDEDRGVGPDTAEFAQALVALGHAAQRGQQCGIEDGRVAVAAGVSGDGDPGVGIGAERVDRAADARDGAGLVDAGDDDPVDVGGDGARAGAD